MYTCPAGFDVNLTTAASCNAIVGGALATVAPVAEVYGLSATTYTLALAQAKCASYGATLATTAQLTAARTAGAAWTTPGWVSDNSTSVMYPGASSVVSVAPGAGRISGANCFGIKPPQGQFTDILPWYPGSWNSMPQCPQGFNITTNATCYSTCPSGTYPSGGGCIPPIVPKTSTAAITQNYTCPAGFDAPAVVTCSGSTCGPAQTCFSTCAAGFTGSGTSCVGAISQKAQQVASSSKTGYTCPAGYTLSLSTCYQNCPSGSTDIGNNRCQVNSRARTTTAATYRAPCPANHTQSGSTCHMECASMTPTGMQDIGGNKCQLPNTARTTSTPTPVRSTLVPCNSDEDTVTSTQGLRCVKKCAENEISSATTCSPQDFTPTGYAAIFTCNSNETLKNGICISKCPEGTFPDGELCVSKIKVITPPSSIKCVSSAFGSFKKWTCDTSAGAAELLKDPSSTTTYVDPADQICIADDSDAGMYYCQSGAEAKEGTRALDIVRNDYSKTCSNVKKSYMDLSNNLTSLLLIQSGMTNGSTQLTTAKTALDSILTQLNCETPPNTRVAALCTQIRNGSTAIGTDSTNISSVLSNITPSIQAAMTSRDSLLSSIANFKCNT